MKKRTREEQRFYREMGARLAALRIQRTGLSQSGLAREIGERPNTVNRWESGFYRPSILDLMKLRHLFGCDRLEKLIPELPEVMR